MNFYEDLEVGSRREIGDYTFTAEAIKKFAAKYDPQRFHLDEEAGRHQEGQAHGRRHGVLNHEQSGDEIKHASQQVEGESPPSAPPERREDLENGTQQQ